jgi:hypothetical protein
MADDSKTIFTDDGIPIKWLPKDVDNFLDKTTLIYGGTFSGKTTIIEEILYLVKDYIPNYLVIANENSMKAYKNKVPMKCIKKDLSKKKLQQIWERQACITQLYETANDIKVLEALFKRIIDRETSAMINAVQKRANECIQVIESKSDIDYAQKKSQKTAIEELRIKKIKDLYKNAIRSNADKLVKAPLSDHEKVALEYIDLNPRLMIIIDDCTDKFGMWWSYFKKSEVNPFKSIFFEGRHNYITLVFAAHDDKNVDTELRKNSRTTIYTTSQALMASIDKKSNGYTPKEKKMAEKLATKIFGDEKAVIKTHQKLCYVREDLHPFRYTIANLYPDFQLGCEPLWDLTKKMPKRTDPLSENKYLKDVLKKKRR